MYRIHDKPDLEKLKTLHLFVTRLGIPMEKPSRRTSPSPSAHCCAPARPPRTELVQTMAIRSMAKAVYSTQNIGHYGLAFDYYSRHLAHSPLPGCDGTPLAPALPGRRKIGGRRSDGAAVQAQLGPRENGAGRRWASIKYKQVEFADKVDPTFKGMVSGLSAGGFFVELEDSKCEGRVSVDDLDGYFDFDEERYELVNSKTREIFRLGERWGSAGGPGPLVLRRLDFKF